jgi:hypothetical protein
MLLQYEYDGNAATFTDGDPVTVRLSLRQDGERKVVTLPSTVRRVDQNGIGVEFQRRETELLELLKPCRLDTAGARDAQFMHRAAGTVGGAGGSPVARLAASRGSYRAPRKQALPPLPGTQDRPDSGAADQPAAMRPRRSAAAPTDRGLYYVGLVSLVCAILILTIDFADSSRLKTRLSALESSNRGHASALTEIRERHADLVPGRSLEKLNTRVETLAVSLASLEGKLLRAESERAARNAAARQGGAQPGAEAAAAQAVREVAARVDAPLPGGDGPWRINLVSLYDKAAADRFTAKAKSQDVDVEQNRVEVKGRDVWRLQVSGFATQEQARAYGAKVQDQLGLDGVWVFKR